MQTFTITKHGKLTLDGSSHNQCKKKGHKNFAWEVECKCKNKLDQQGFIIDNAEIDKAVDKGAKSLSCELLCLFITNELEYLLLQHECLLVSIKVLIIPIGVDITTKMELVTTY